MGVDSNGVQTELNDGQTHDGNPHPRAQCCFVLKRKKPRGLARVDDELQRTRQADSQQDNKGDAAIEFKDELLIRYDSQLGNRPNPACRTGHEVENQHRANHHEHALQSIRTNHGHKSADGRIEHHHDQSQANRDLIGHIKKAFE